MIHSGLEALQGDWDREEYVAGYRARFSVIPDFEEAHPCWRTGWEDADTELLESARHNRILAECREDEYPDTWGCSLTRAAMPVRMASPSMRSVLHLGKRAGSRRTSTLECVESRRFEEGNTTGDAMPLRKCEDSRAWSVLYLLHAQAPG
jgi:hypothetical protein